MRRRKYSIIGLVLFITVMFTGMCFEDVKTDSSFAYIEFDKTSTQMVAVGTVINDEQLCTTRMLRVQGRTVIQQLNSSFVQQRGEAKASYEILCPDILTEEKGVNSSDIWINLLENLNPEERITMFEHKADGKKRIG